MLDLLRDYLDTATTPEEKNHIAIADRVLTRIQDENYEHVIEEILMLDQDMDAGTTLPSIVAVYRKQLYFFFTCHGMTVAETLSLKHLALLADGVLNLDNHENPLALFHLSDENAPTLEKVCVMLRETTPFAVDELLHMVEDVADGFIQRLKTATHVVEHLDESDLINARERMHAYRLYLVYLQSVGATVTYIDTILRSGGGPAMPYSFYTKMIDGQQPIEVMPARQAAQELFGAALVSDDGYGNPGETVKANLEQYISDPKAISNVMVEVRQIMMGYKP